MTDLIERLRSFQMDPDAVMKEAADEIERLQACFDQRNDALIASCKRNRELQAFFDAVDADDWNAAHKIHLAIKAERDKEQDDMQDEWDDFGPDGREDSP